MKIAIVAPTPVPFCIGGAEYLWWALLDHINKETIHQAELIKLPSRENSFWDLITTYHEFARLDLGYFDMVISSKYPSWMVDHPRHVCYMAHKLRGLYDTYHFTKMPERAEADHPAVREIQAFIAEHAGKRESLGAFFSMLDLMKRRRLLPEAALQFPGPLIREIIHFLDGIGQAGVTRFAAISRNVAQRRDYFPTDASVSVFYPPSALREFSDSGQKYLFTIGRLDGAKRIRMIVEAMAHVKTAIHLKIAGTGPDETELKRLAANDDRIEFLGFVNDGDVPALYAGALGVVYVPYDEDYGLVTIEAMMSNKPVITTTDSGGALEFVRNGETGYVTEPNPVSLAAGIDALAGNKDQAAAMGRNGRLVVSKITWENVALGLLDMPVEKKAQVYPSAKPKLVLAGTFPIYPPRGGGQSRIYHLYRNLARDYNVEIVSFTAPDRPYFESEIAPGLREIRIPKSEAHQQAEMRTTMGVNGVTVSDVTMPEFFHLTPAYGEKLALACTDADAVIASHPYLYTAIKTHAPDKPLIHESHNVEYLMKKDLLPENETGAHLLELTRQVEGACCETAVLTITCSSEDGVTLGDLYGLDPSRTTVVHNGVDLESVDFVPYEARLATKQRHGLETCFTVLFIGSWHPPNIEAIDFIARFADELPDMHFLVMGSVGHAVKGRSFPANLCFLGTVDDETKNTLLGTVDVAINPMMSGSGTNLKMLDYLAAGVPVLSTPFGARGLDLADREHLLLAEIDGFVPMLLEMRSGNEALLSHIIKNGLAKVREVYDWRVIAKNYRDHLKRVLG